MLRYVGLRLLQAIPVLVGILLIDFLIIHLPGHAPGGMAVDRPPTVDDIALHREHHGLDQPMPRRFAQFIGDVSRLDMKSSMVTHEPVNAMISEALGPTLALQIPALLLMLAAGIPLGVLAAQRRGKILDRVISIKLLVLMAIPDYWLATLLLLFFATDAGFNAFPFGGLHDRDVTDAAGLTRMLDTAHHLVLPVIALSAAGVAVIARHVRSSMIGVLDSEYIRAARAAGLSERTLVWRHGLRNALGPTATLVGAMVPALIGGSIIIENLFDIHGMGRLLWTATFDSDYPVLQALFLMTALLTLLGYLLSDVAVAWLNPKVRLP